MSISLCPRYYNYELSINGKEERHGDDYAADYLTDVIGRKAHAFLERAANGEFSREDLRVFAEGKQPLI